MKHVLTFFLMMCCTTLALAQPSQEAQTILRTAYKLYNQSKFQEGLDETYKIQAADVDAEVLYWRGNFLQKLKNYDEAVEQYNQAISLDGAHIGAGEQLRNLREPERTLRSAYKLFEQRKFQEGLDETYKLKPTDVNADVFYWRGNFLKKLKKIDDAIEQYNQAISLDANHIESKKQLNVLLAGKEKSPLSTAFYLYDRRKFQDGLDETYKLEPADVDAEVLFWRGNFLKKLKRKGEAIEQYNQAISLDEHHIEAREQLSILYFEKQNYAAAYEHLAKIFELKPDDDQLMLNLGVSAYHLGQYYQAIDWLTKYLEKNQENRAAHYRIAAAYSETDYHAIALEHLQTSADLGYPRAVQRMEEGFNEYRKIDYTSVGENTTVNRGRTGTLNADDRMPLAGDDRMPQEAGKKMTKKELRAARKRAKKARKRN